MDEEHRHPELSRQQVALFQRNPVCALCYRVCMELCKEYGGLRFDLLESIIAADELCEKIVQHPWELSGIEYYRDWVRNRLSFSPPAVACTFATVCVTFGCMENLPAPVRQLAHDFQGLIIGEGNELYDSLRSAAHRQDITLAYETYGEPPPEPSWVHEYEHACQRAAQLEQEVRYYKTRLEMKNKNLRASAPVIHVAGNLYDIHDNNHCNIYATEPKDLTNEGVKELRSEGVNAARVKRLFMTNGIEDMQRTEEEKNRFRNYLTDHHLGQRQLDCSADNPIHKAIVCFCVKWKRLKYIDKPSPAAVLRFLTETCGIPCASESSALCTLLGRMFKNEYDKEVFFDVEDYF